MAKLSDRQYALHRAEYACEYCKLLTNYFTSTPEIEHIIPLSKGGRDERSNYAIACGFCNRYKGDATEGLDSVSQEITPLFNPRTDNWIDHFKWSSDTLSVIGKTPIGRVTVERLKLNRTTAINLRRVTIDLGHPPASTK